METLKESLNEVFTKLGIFGNDSEVIHSDNGFIIGDLCYVHDLDDIPYGAISLANEHGKIYVKNGKALTYTFQGDGCYDIVESSFDDKDGRKDFVFPVDSGTLGAIDSDLATKDGSCLEIHYGEPCTLYYVQKLKDDCKIHYFIFYADGVEEIDYLVIES